MKKGKDVAGETGRGLAKLHVSIQCSLARNSVLTTIKAPIKIFGRPSLLGRVTSMIRQSMRTPLCTTMQKRCAKYQIVWLKSMLISLPTSSSVLSEPVEPDCVKPHSGHLKAACAVSFISTSVSLPGDVALLLLGVKVSYPILDVGRLLDGVDMPLMGVEGSVASVNASPLDARRGSC